MKICVFQGTFNPIHNAHLKVCDYIKSNFSCDKILLIPAQIPPHKDFDESLAFHRLNMAKLAVKERSYLSVSDIEYRRPETSYTFYTIKQLCEEYNPKEKINFIIGTDAFRKIESWHRADELKKLVHFILFRRENEEEFDCEFFENLRKKGYNYTLMNMPYTDISSTQIRNAVNQSVPVTGTVPKAVEEYIKKHELYKN